MKKIKELNKIKYIITLDADTDLILNSAFELVGAMAHILNRPVIDETKKYCSRWIWNYATTSRNKFRYML